MLVPDLKHRQFDLGTVVVLLADLHDDIINLTSSIKSVLSKLASPPRLMAMLYFSASKKRIDESIDFDCNNLQTLNALRNTSGITELEMILTLFGSVATEIPNSCLLFVVVTLIMTIRGLKTQITLRSSRYTVKFFQQNHKRCIFQKCVIFVYQMINIG